MGWDFRKQATQLDVPVYFLIGPYDINAPKILVEQYLEVLEEPYKEIVWFEHSGHTTWVSESDRFVKVMVDTVLAQIHHKCTCLPDHMQTPPLAGEFLFGWAYYQR